MTDNSQSLEGEALREALRVQVEETLTQKIMSGDSEILGQAVADPDASLSHLCVPLHIVASIPAVKAFAPNSSDPELMTLVSTALKSSSTFSIIASNETAATQLIRTPFKKSQRNTLILRDVAAGVTEEEVRQVFGGVGGVTVTGVKKEINNCWFVTFADEQMTVQAFTLASKALLHGESVHARIKSEPLQRGGYVSLSSSAPQQQQMYYEQMMAYQPQQQPQQHHHQQKRGQQQQTTMNEHQQPKEGMTSPKNKGMRRNMLSMSNGATKQPTQQHNSPPLMTTHQQQQGGKPHLTMQRPGQPKKETQPKKGGKHKTESSSPPLNPTTTAAQTTTTDTHQHKPAPVEFPPLPSTTTTMTTMTSQQMPSTTTTIAAILRSEKEYKHYSREEAIRVISQIVSDHSQTPQSSSSSIAIAATPLTTLENSIPILPPSH